MKKIIFICLFTLLCLSKFSAQSQTPELVYIRIQEPIKSAGGEATMIIIKPDNTIETVELKKLGLGGSSLDENGVLVKNEIAKWLTKGFKVVSLNSSGGDYFVRTEIFLKKD